MTLYADAIAFASRAHEGAFRKGTNIPYIVHPLEAASIAATLTDDEEILAAAVLHDVIEDCGVTEEELAARFSARVASIVRAESQTKHEDPFASWDTRKKEAIARLTAADRAQKIVTLGDKLSNMRAIRRDYDAYGEDLFFRFHQHKKSRHAWYYRSCAELLRDELGSSEAWQELHALIEYVFADIPKAEPA